MAEQFYKILLLFELASIETQTDVILSIDIADISVS